MTKQIKGKQGLLHVCHIITDLELGGAEMMLYKLLSHFDRSKFRTTVVSLTRGGEFTSKIKALGVEVIMLDFKAGILTPFNLIKLVIILYKKKPDLVQTWMYHADLIGGIAAKLAGSFPVVWGIRNSTLDARFSNPKTVKLVRMNARLAKRLATAIVSNSCAARDVHIKLGFPFEIISIIPNGFDLKEFAPNRSAYQSVRKELGLNPGTMLIGMVGRFDPQKDHDTFIQAVVLLSSKNKNSHFLLVGRNITWKNSSLSRQIKLAGLSRRFHLLGPRLDVPQIMASLDVFVSSSAYGESFPNVLGEAMASGIPCVASDVGDSAKIIGATGLIVPPRDPYALATAILEIISLSPHKRRQLGSSARRRIRRYYTLDSMIRNYASLYRAVLKRR